jgi:hypothetical protein
VIVLAGPRPPRQNLVMIDPSVERGRRDPWFARYFLGLTVAGSRTEKWRNGAGLTAVCNEMPNWALPGFVGLSVIGTASAIALLVDAMLGRSAGRLTPGVTCLGINQ